MGLVFFSFRGLAFKVLKFKGFRVYGLRFGTNLNPKPCRVLAAQGLLCSSILGFVQFFFINGI